MAEPYRNQILWLSIRDGGYVCDEVLTSEHPGGDVEAWFVRCDGAVAFDVSIDDYGRISVAPSPLNDSIVPQIRPAQ